MGNAEKVYTKFMEERSVGEENIIENGDVSDLGHFEDLDTTEDDVRHDASIEAINQVESPEFRQTLLLMHEMLRQVGKEGFHMDVVGNIDGPSSRVVDFKSVQPRFSDDLVLYVVGEAKGVHDKENKNSSGLTAEVRAIAIQDRKDKGVLVTTIGHNASSADISIVELDRSVPFESVRRGDDDQLFDPNSATHVELMRIALNQGDLFPSECGPEDTEFHFLPEARYYHQPKLGGAVVETLKPLLGAVRSSLSAQWHETPVPNL